MNQSLSHKITLAQLDVIDQDITSATGLPNAAYTDRAFFTFERDHILGTSWTALAFCVDYEANNTITPIEFMGLPLMIVNDKHGGIKVFHNVCSHRGRILVTEKKKTNGMLVCPYHSWTYDLSGKLCATPHIGGFGTHHADGFCPQNHGLKEVRSHCWLGVLFINLSADAEAFDDYAKPLLERYHGFEQIEYATNNGKILLSVNCNWKLAIENFCEAYHLPSIHPSLNAYSPLEKHYNLIISKDFAGQRTTCFSPNNANRENLPRFEHWSQAQAGCAEYPVFYPNLFLGIQEDHLFAAIITPIDIDKTDEDLRLIYVNPEAANGDQFEAARIANHSAWKKVFSEDVTSIEGMQRGRHSTAYNGGAFSPAHETVTLHFYQWLARKYRIGINFLLGENMKIEYEIIHKSKFEDSHRTVFEKLLKKQGKVQGCLRNKVDRCKLICIVKIDGKEVAIGAIKEKTNDDFSNEKAGIPDLSNEFEWELGYLYTDKDHEGRKIASTITRLLIDSYGKESLMASTEITDNPAMVKILENHGFRLFGTPWESNIHGNYLGLFLKFK